MNKTENTSRPYGNYDDSREKRVEEFIRSKREKINFDKNLVPFQSLSLNDQHKCIELFGHPYEFQHKDNSKVGKNNQETETLKENCVVDNKLQHPPRIPKKICQTCNQLKNVAPLKLYVRKVLNGKTQHHSCLIQLMDYMNQVRKLSGCRQLSHNQIYEKMKLISLLHANQVENN